MTRSALVAAAALIAAGASGSGAEARVVSSCSAAGSETLRENSVARVYETRDDVIACSKRTGHREGILMGERIWQLRLRGHYVAYAFFVCIDLDEDCNDGIERVDVRSGRFSSVRGGGDGDVVRVELRRTGSVAWSEDERGTGEVYRRDRDGFRRLERAAGLDAASLRLRRTTLSWLTDGERRTATLR